MSPTVLVSAAVAVLVALSTVDAPSTDAASDRAPTARQLPGVTLTVERRLGLLATTTPAVDSVVFAAGAGATSAESTAPAVVSTRADMRHAITVAEAAPCAARVADDDAGTASAVVEWSADDGRSWHALTPAPASIARALPAGENPAAVTVRFRRVALAGAGGCVLRVQYAVLPAP